MTYLREEAPHRFRSFLRLVGRIEERWIKTGDPELRRIADELYEWDRGGGETFAALVVMKGER